MDINKDALISKVYLRNVIWDRTVKGHANRKIVDKAWKEIAEEFGIENDQVLRKKWKNLRDQFCVEIGKYSSSGDPGGKSESTWSYLKPLSFLMGMVKPRPSSSNLIDEFIPVPQEYQIPITEISTSPINESGAESVYDAHGTQRTIGETPSDEYPSFPQKRKNISKYDEDLIHLEQKKTRMLENVIENWKSDECEDMLFFRSLLPHVMEIPKHLKMKFRNKVQDLVQDYAYSGEPDKQCGASSSIHVQDT